MTKGTPRNILTEQDVREIRAAPLWIPNTVLAHVYHVSHVNIWKVRKNRAWTHVTAVHYAEEQKIARQKILAAAKTTNYLLTENQAAALGIEA